MMNIVNITILILVHINLTWESYCGCKKTRDCYKEMIDKLLDRDETPCIENAVLGSATITIYLKALKEYCGAFIDYLEEYVTFEGRNLYEVSIQSTHDETRRNSKPVILIDAGQRGGSGPVDLALFVIEQLVACEEYNDMIKSAHWVILPSTNPDALEYNYFIKPRYKNFRPSDTEYSSIGIDISRNFNESWNICSNSGNVYSENYKGAAPATEIETLFMLNVFGKYNNDIKAYLSLRRDGHSILYPYASENATSGTELAKKKSGDIAAKVNYRGGIVQWFVNDSIYNMNGKPVCGHSVDYVFNNLRVPYSYEMRVFLAANQEILSNYQKLPLGYNSSLRYGYFDGIKELYNVAIKGDKRNNIF